MESQPTPRNGHCHNGWFINLCDPSSLVCDALLENKTCSNTPYCVLYCTASQTSLFSGTPAQSVFHDSSDKPRSRSEDNRCISKGGGCTCSSENDPLSSAVSSCCSRSNFCFGTGLSSPVSTPSPTGSCLDSTDGGPKNNPPKSLKSSDHLINDRSVNSVYDSSSASPSLPPPMRIINLDRLSVKDSLPGEVKTALELSTDLTVPECPSTQCNPATMLQQCVLSHTSKHGSVSEYNVTTDLTERLRAESHTTPRLRPYNLLHTHETSARDSGLSSQSSNSTNLASTFRVDDRDYLEFSRYQPPPPVPPHAPHSRATAAAKLAAQSSGAPAASGRTSPAVASKDRVHGLTIRLSLNRRSSKPIPMVHLWNLCVRVELFSLFSVWLAGLSVLVAPHKKFTTVTVQLCQWRIQRTAVANSVLMIRLVKPIVCVYLLCTLAFFSFFLLSILRQSCVDPFTFTNFMFSS
ncbi:hypothetical protein AHF37_10875 [Paragonimus kellicotti]|nr:hypothetical protein AHF37_10875 [Paragonimus kellicotti]